MLGGKPVVSPLKSCLSAKGANQGSQGKKSRIPSEQSVEHMESEPGTGTRETKSAKMFLGTAHGFLHGFLVDSMVAFRVHIWMCECACVTMNSFHPLLSFRITVTLPAWEYSNKFEVL